MKYLGGWVVVGILGLGSLVSACSDPDPAPGPAGASEFFEQLAQIRCAGVAPCCRQASIAYDEATCLAKVREELAEDATELGSSKYRYDSNAAAGCLNEAKRVLAACEEFEDDTTGAACAVVFLGTLPLGAACNERGECANSADCSADAAGPGVCTKATEYTFTHAKLGEACVGDCTATRCRVYDQQANPAAVCFEAEGLSCSSSVCGKIAAVGEACGATQTCTTGAYCDTTLAKCAARKPEGAACTEGFECQQRDCNGGICQRDQVASEESCRGEL